MRPIEEVSQIRQRGMETAATIWVTLESLSEPIDAANIYKATCAIKCAEFVARIRTNPLFDVILPLLGEFLDGTLEIAQNYPNDKSEGMRVITVLETAMPLTTEVFNDSAAYASRQFAYDGVIMLAATKLGKETETRECIEGLQLGVAKAMLTAIMVEVESSSGPQPAIHDVLTFSDEPENE